MRETAKVVQQLLRHSSQQVTTEVYMHLFPEDLDRLREGLDRVYAEASAEPHADAEAPQGVKGTVVPLSTRRSKRASR